MAKYELTLAYDISCYCTVTIEADSAEEAEKIALERDATHQEDWSFDPDWSTAGDTRVACEAMEVEEVS